MSGSLLGNHDFRRLFVADVISQAGSQLSMLALPLLAVQTLNATPLEVGLLFTCETVGFAIVGLPAGALVDRWSRRRVLIGTNLGRMIVLGALAAAAVLGVLTFPELYAGALLTGVLAVFFDIAYQSYLPSLVKTDQLAAGNATLEAVGGVSRIAGPALAGVLIELVTTGVAVTLDAVSFGAAALVLRRIRRREVPAPAATDARLLREVMDGLRFVTGHRALRTIALVTGLGNLFNAMTAPMLLVFLNRDLGLSATMIGLILSCGGAGGIAGALVSARIAKRWGPGPTLWRSLALGSPCGLLVPLAERGWSVWLCAVAVAGCWFGAVVYNITQVTLRQSLTPQNLLGRMNATMRFFVWGTLPLGGFLGGLLAEHVGVRGALWVSTCGAILALVPLTLSPLRRLRALPGPGAEARNAL